MDNNAKIATLLIRAQNCSNGGKRNKYAFLHINSQRSLKDNKRGYKDKENYLLQAVNIISAGKSNFIFAYNSKEGIVLFQTKKRINGTKYKLAFHVKKGDKFHETPYTIQWKKASSNKAAAELYRYYCPNGQYIY